MKNRHTQILVSVTGLFLAFVLGFLLGRTTQRTGVQISYPADTLPVLASQPVREPVVRLSSDSADAPSQAPEETSETEACRDETEATVSRININTATLAQLESLPGIGEVLAQRIIDYRQDHGPFTSVSQLTLVEGIGAKRLAAILDLITAE